MKLPKVAGCENIDCAYNMENSCHAAAVTIGDGRVARCYTCCQFLMKGKGGDTGRTARVGACKVSGCVYNTALECQAPEIFVGIRESHSVCLTCQSCYETLSESADDSRLGVKEGEFCTLPEVFIG